MRHHKGFLTPEERARITELQDLFVQCYVERKKAVADGQEERVKSVEAEIDINVSNPFNPWRAPVSNLP